MTGTDSDLISEVNDELGGTYSITYANFNTLDNTGEDNIPDLSLSYKVYM